MSSSNSLFQAMKEIDNVTTTENGMVAYKSTLSYVLDLFQGGFSHRRNPEAVEQLVIDAAHENKELTLKCLFYLRDIHEGQGEREVFRHGMRAFLKLYPDAIRNLAYIPNGLDGKPYGRWDDLVHLLGVSPEVDAHIFDIISEQLSKDQIAFHESRFSDVSLLAKWLPSCNTSSKKTCALGKKVWKGLGLSSERKYRKILSDLRRAVDVVEQKISTKNYSFDYSKLPSLAASKYRRAFARNDGARYSDYLANLNLALCSPDNENSDVKVNTATLYPYDVVRPLLRKMKNNFAYDSNNITYNGDENTATLADCQWRSLRNYFEGGAGNHNWLAVVDTSGSMFDSYGESVGSIDVAISLGMYIAQHNNGIFKNKFISFESKPSLFEIYDDCSLVENVIRMVNTPWGNSTNLEGVFDLILDAAVSHKIPAEEMPESVVIISDMQFDYAVNNSDAFDMIRKKYEDAGYVCPNLVFWNVCARYDASKPVTIHKSGAILVGGCKPGLFEQILASKSPEEFMLDVLNGPRYQIIH